MAWEVRLSYAFLLLFKYDVYLGYQLCPVQIQHGKIHECRLYFSRSYRPFDLLRLDGEVEDARCTARGLPHLQRKVGCCDGHVPSSCKLLRTMETLDY